MDESKVTSIYNLAFWDKLKDKRSLLSFSIDITPRCNNDCRHCYINLPAGDKHAREVEITLEEIETIADEAVELGAMWCLISGGEPLLRKDFPEIYLALKKRGLLVTVFTNATLITEEHIELFKKYPPRDIEITVYGVTEETYGRVTQKPENFSAFMHGLNLLLDNGIKVRLKTVALRSNFEEHEKIAQFCREKTRDYFRFDPLINLRHDRDPVRNEMIKSERLTPEEIVFLERHDPDRARSMEEECETFIFPEVSAPKSNWIISCGAGVHSFSVSYDAKFRLCSSLVHPDTVYDLRKGTLTDAWNNFVPKVRAMQSHRQEFLDRCRSCPIVNLCMMCAARAYLETGEMDKPVEYFCEVAHARAKALKEAVSAHNPTDQDPS